MTKRDVILLRLLSWAPIPNSWKQEIWSWFPDYCENPHCWRNGVRGNENVVDGVVLCDMCCLGLGKPVE